MRTTFSSGVEALPSAARTLSLMRRAAVHSISSPASS